ncbi:MAG: GntR family transcriptional regulator, partial [Pygmaiobacter sp.]
MNWELNSDRPVYLQLVEHLQFSIISGEFPPGSRVPSVRELAADAAVNPNTMQKALTELEADGLVLTQRTSGRTVTQETERIVEQHPLGKMEQ